MSAESLGLLAEFLDLEHAALIQDAVRIPRARVFLDGRTLRARVDPPAASIARFELDAALWQSARSAGVDARQQVTVQSIAGRGPFRIATSDGEFESRALVNASGRWSNLNLPPAENGVPREKWLGVKAHFAEPPSEPSVDLYFFEGGYCGVQPVAVAGESGGRVNASAMVRADVASTLPEVFARHPALSERSRNWSPLSDPVSTSPLIFRQPQPERDGMLMVGDAAGFVDPFVGDGISLALRGGALAAHCLGSFFSGEASLPRSGAALWPSLRAIAVAGISRLVDDPPHACPARRGSQTAAVYSGAHSRDYRLSRTQDPLRMQARASSLVLRHQERVE